MIDQVTIIGTGLIGTSVGLALKRAGFTGEIVGWDKCSEEAQIALKLGAVTQVTSDPDGAAYDSDVVLLATPVLAVMHWMERLAPAMANGQLITDVGSTKLEIAKLALSLYPQGKIGGQHKLARFLPGHPMAGKESGGAALGEASLFDGATWLFTPVAEETELEREWREWVRRFGCRVVDMEAGRHDVVCAWVSHMPQMVATAMAALLEDEFRDSPEAAGEFMAIGGRALREMTRLGASPYSMWRDVAMTNTDAIAGVLFALEQRLAHVRENLKTPELREEFRLANAFRGRR